MSNGAGARAGVHGSRTVSVELSFREASLFVLESLDEREGSLREVLIKDGIGSIGEQIPATVPFFWGEMSSKIVSGSGSHGHEN